MNRNNLCTALCRASSCYNKDQFYHFGDANYEEILKENLISPFQYYKSNTEAELFYGKGKDETDYFVFFPTNSLKDALYDAYVARVELGTGEYVHKGMWLEFVSIQEFIDSRIKDISSDSKIIFCGFSLGGAMAMIAAYHYSSIGISNDIEVYTCGAPNFGNSALVKKIDSFPNISITRNVLNGDPIPYYPLGFKQPKSVLFLQVGKKPLNYIPCWKKIRTMVLCPVPLVLIDHNISKYYQALTGITSN